MKERKITKLIQKFVGDDLTVAFGDDFAYLLGTGWITWGVGENPVVNYTWAYRLKEDYNFRLTNENVFLLSILHEVGHYMTEDDFSEEQWEMESVRKNAIGDEMDETNFMEKNQEYYLMPTEKAATDWAIDFYLTHKSDMRRWAQRFNCAIRRYEKSNKKLVFDRFKVVG